MRRRRTDLEVLLEQGGAFRCHTCSDAPPLLYRVRIQECPTRNHSLEEWLDGERFTIRRRLLCQCCLAHFVFYDGKTAAFATINDTPWCLRQDGGRQPTAYTPMKWQRYVQSVSQRRTGGQPHRFMT